jgi:hypothetical protein
MLLEKDWSFWKEAIFRDLERVHKDTRQCVSRIDIMRMGHAAVRPTVGAVTSGASKIAAAEWPNLVRQFRSKCKRLVLPGSRRLDAAVDPAISVLQGLISSMKSSSI